MTEYIESLDQSKCKAFGSLCDEEKFDTLGCISSMQTYKGISRKIIPFF